MLHAYAQSVPAPAVSVTRNLPLSQHVWPGDFNGDGRTDLAASEPSIWDGGSGIVTVALGNGAGGFSTPIRTSFVGRVAGAADFNGDAKSDLLVISDSRTGVFILAGNGNGTFGGAIAVHSGSDITFAVSSDLNGDGKRDVIVGAEGQTALVFPGRGDFSFGVPTSLTTGDFPNDATIADLNGDGRRDFVVANHYNWTITVFINQGGLQFTRSDVAVGGSANDVTAADFNGDGKMDLAVATTNGGDIDFYFLEGHADVLLGRGDGTFASPVRYETLRGAWQIVAGDFNSDGRVDIATGNRSSIYVDDCSGGILGKTWDSVSILPGTGSGSFLAPSHFSIGDQTGVTEGPYRNRLVSLNTNDANKDGRTDLIASYGAILFNRAAAANRPPTVDAGPDRVTNNNTFLPRPVASDPDHDVLAWSWTDSTGHQFARWPTPCAEGGLFQIGRNVFTLTVDDGHGHRVSDTVTVDYQPPSNDPMIAFTDPIGGAVIAEGQPHTIRWTASSMLAGEHLTVGIYDDQGDFTPLSGCVNIAVAANQCTWNAAGPVGDNHTLFAWTIDGSTYGTGFSEFFAIRPAGEDPPLPSPWQHQDVGAVGAPGSVSYANGVFTVDASGADIWNAADEFHFVYRNDPPEPSGGGPPQVWEITTRVDSVENVNQWTKAGLMIRGGLEPDAPHAMVLVTPGKGVNFQWRTATGATAQYLAGPVLTAPVWLKLAVTQNVVSAYYRKNITDPWTVLGRRTFLSWGATTQAGLAVTSHSDGAVATAKFSNTTAALRDLGVSANVGGGGGSSTGDGVIYSITGRGTDIWNTNDQFRFHYAPWAATRASIGVRVLTVQNVHAWTKAGIMIRDVGITGGLDAAARFVFVAVTPGKGVTMQFRASTGGQAMIAGGAPGVAPAWVRISQNGDSYTGEWSKDGVTWTVLGTVSMPVEGAYAGLAVSSHNATTAATATFDDVTIVR